MTAAAAEESGEFDPFALLTATEAAAYCKVSVQAIINWRNRGHLPVAVRDDGTVILDGRGKPMYRLVDVARVDARMSAARERMALRLVAGQARYLRDAAAAG